MCKVYGVALLICPEDVGMAAEELVDERSRNPWLSRQAQPAVWVAL